MGSVCGPGETWSGRRAQRRAGRPPIVPVWSANCAVRRSDPRPIRIAQHRHLESSFTPRRIDCAVSAPSPALRLAAEMAAAARVAREGGSAARRMEYLTHYYTSAGMTDSVLHLYLATELSEVPAKAHGPEEEHMEMVELPLAEAVEMVVRGEINDSKTVIGLLLVDRQLNS